MSNARTKWRGWVTIHRGKRAPSGELVPGQQIASSPVFEFELPGDANNVDLAREHLEIVWHDGGRQVSAQWTDADNAVSYMNVEAVRER